MSDLVIEMVGSVVGPDDVLVLALKEPAEFEDLAELLAQIPEPLRARVLVVEGADTHVIKGGAA